MGFMGALSGLSGFGLGDEDDEDKDKLPGLDTLVSSRFFGKGSLVDEGGGGAGGDEPVLSRLTSRRSFSGIQNNFTKEIKRVEEENRKRAEEAKRLQKEKDFKESREGIIQTTLRGQLEGMKKKRSSLNRSGVGLDGAPIASQILMGR